MDLEEEHLNEISQNGYKVTKVLGEGGFGKVYKVHDYTNKLYAVKAVKFISDEVVYVEQYILKALNGHPFIMHFVDSFAQNQNFYFVFELLQINLLTIFNYVGVFSEREAAFYMKEIILGVEYMHYRDIIYHDLKFENILVDEKGHIRLADFGLSEEMIDDEPSFLCCGTPAYMAPEVINKSGHGKEADWWSLGVMFYVMLTGELPFQNFEDILEGQYILPEELSPEAKDLLTKLLQVNPCERIGSASTGAGTIRRHKFFENTCWIKVLDRLEVPPFEPIIYNDDDDDETNIICSHVSNGTETAAYLIQKALLMHEV